MMSFQLWNWNQSSVMHPCYVQMDCSFQPYRVTLTEERKSHWLSMGQEMFSYSQGSLWFQFKELAPPLHHNDRGKMRAARGIYVKIWGSLNTYFKNVRPKILRKLHQHSIEALFFYKDGRAGRGAQHTLVLQLYTRKWQF